MAENSHVDSQRTRDCAASPRSPETTIDGALEGQPSTEARIQIAASALPIEAPVIPGFHLTDLIGKGGMGRVYAGRDLALERNVAIKTLLPGADADRFMTESRITARLPHPGIPPVHALGRLADGTPYLAMKLIHGRTLADLLSERSSSSDDLSPWVRIFEQVSLAAGFAHSRGIIHRDLKPANVMVGEFGEVQVMDWGLAKDLATSPHTNRESGGCSTADPDHTLAGAVMGTPGYMAPEQARGETVDARADVFALGAVLATILTGCPAFVGTTMREVIDKSARGELADVLARLANCGADAELVGLATRCLAPNPADRPADAREVAQQVAAYRSGVDARWRQAETQAAEAAVRVAEVRKRQRVLLGASSLIAGVLMTGLVVSLLLLNRATSAEREAKAKAKEAQEERNAKDVALKVVDQKRQEAETNLDFANKGNAILGSVFAGLDPKANYTTVADLRNAIKLNLQQAVQELESSAIGNPLVVAEMQNRLGMSLLGLGEPALAIELFDKARNTYEDKLGPEHQNTLISVNNLASAYGNAGQFDKALPLLEHAFELRASMFGPAHVNTAPILNSLAIAYYETGQPEKAQPLFKESLKLKTEQFGPEHTETMVGLNNLAMAHRAAGQYAEALTLLEDVHRILTTQHGPDHPDALAAKSNLALCYQTAGRLDKALPLLEETLQREAAQFGRDHPITISSMNNLATAYSAAGEFSKALPIFEETFQLFSTKLGADHPTTLRGMSNLAQAYQDAGQLDKALPMLEEALRLRRANLAPDHPDVLSSMNNLAMGYKAAKRLGKALPLLEETLKLQEARFGPDHPTTVSIGGNLAAVYREVKQVDKALPIFERTWRLWERQFGQDHPKTLAVRNSLAACYRDAGQLDKALPLFEDTLQLMTAKLGADHPTTLNTMNNLALCYLDARRFDKALPVFEEALKHRTARLGRDHPDTLNSMHSLGAGYRSAGQLDKALPLLEETLSLSITKLGPEHRDALGVRYQLGKAYSSANLGDNAATHLLEYLQGWRKQYSPNDSRLADLLIKVAVDLLNCSQHAAAEPLLRECLAIREQATPDDWNTFYTHSLLGEALLGQKKHAEAEPFLVTGYEGLKQREKTLPSPANLRMTNALDRLIAVYTALAQPENVKKYQELRSAYPAEKQLEGP